MREVVRATGVRALVSRRSKARAISLSLNKVANEWFVCTMCNVREEEPMTKAVNNTVLLGSICAAALLCIGPAAAQQEIKGATGGAMSEAAMVKSVTQTQLDAAARDGSNFLLTNGN